MRYHCAIRAVENRKKGLLLKQTTKNLTQKLMIDILSLHLLYCAPAADPWYQGKSGVFITENKEKINASHHWHDLKLKWLSTIFRVLSSFCWGLNIGDATWLFLILLDGKKRPINMHIGCHLIMWCCDRCFSWFLAAVTWNLECWEATVFPWDYPKFEVKAEELTWIHSGQSQVSYDCLHHLSVLHLGFSIINGL